MKTREKVGEMVPVGDLVPWRDNPRRNAQAVKPVADSIREFGFGAPILARLADKMVIAGHTRLKAAQSLGMETVPVVYLDLTEAQARKLALADNKLGEISSWDDEMLRQVLQELDTEGEDLSVLGWSGADLDKLFADEVDGEIKVWEDGELDSDQQIVALIDGLFADAERVREALDRTGLQYRLHLRFEDGGAEP